MSAPGADGALLISVTSPNPLIDFTGDLWMNAGPASVSVPMPTQLALLGVTVYVQGLIVDANVASGIPFGLTDAVSLTFQN